MSMNTELMNVFLLAVNLIWVAYNTNKIRIIEANQKFAPILIDEIFKPYYLKIECHLFIAITEDNKELISSNLIELYDQLKNKNLLFYISDRLLVSLEETIDISKSSYFDKKEFNRKYQQFSRDYYFELNKFRKIVGLRNRTPYFRIHHNLYKYKIQWLIIKYSYLLPITIIIILYLYYFYNTFLK